MSSGDPKKRPGGSPGNGGSRNPPADTMRPNSAAKKESGRVQFDDRGNAIWEWAVSTGAFGREVSTERMKKLENPGLSLADDAPTPFDKVKAESRKAWSKATTPTTAASSPRAGPQPKKKTDLKKLSDWLQLKKQAANKGPDDDE